MTICCPANVTVRDRGVGVSRANHEIEVERTLIEKRREPGFNLLGACVSREIRNGADPHDQIAVDANGPIALCRRRSRCQPQ